MTEILSKLKSRTEKFGPWLFFFALFLMVGGDFPRFPFGVRERHLVFLVFSSARLYVLLLGIFFIAWVVSGHWKSSGFEPFRFLKRPAVLLTAAFLLSSVFSGYKSLSFWGWAGWLGLIVWLVLFASVLSRNDIREKAWPVMEAAIFFLAVKTLLWRLDEGLLSGTYHIKNTSWLGKLQIAWVLNFFAPFVFARFLGEERALKRLRHAAVWLVLGAAIFVLYARAGFAVFLAVTALMCLLNLGRAKRWLPLLAALAIALLPWAFRAQGRLAYVFESTARFYQDEGFARRVGIWKETLAMFKDHPLTGIGLGTYDDIAYSVYHTRYDASFEAAIDKNTFFKSGWHAHNLFLHILCETGLLGFLAWIYLWYTIAMKIFKSWTETADPDVRLRASALSCFLLAFFVLSQTENLLAFRVHETLRMNLTVGFLLLFALGDLADPERRGRP